MKEYVFRDCMDKLYNVLRDIETKLERIWEALQNNERN